MITIYKSDLYEVAVDGAGGYVVRPRYGPRAVYFQPGEIAEGFGLDFDAAVTRAINKTPWDFGAQHKRLDAWLSDYERVMEAA